MDQAMVDWAITAIDFGEDTTRAEQWFAVVGNAYHGSEYGEQVGSWEEFVARLYAAAEREGFDSATVQYFVETLQQCASDPVADVVMGLVEKQESLSQDYLSLRASQAAQAVEEPLAAEAAEQGWYWEEAQQLWYHLEDNEWVPQSQNGYALNRDKTEWVLEEPGAPVDPPAAEEPGATVEALVARQREQVELFLNAVDVPLNQATGGWWSRLTKKEIESSLGAQFSSALEKARVMVDSPKGLTPAEIFGELQAPLRVWLDGRLESTEVVKKVQAAVRERAKVPDQVITDMLDVARERLVVCFPDDPAVSGACDALEARLRAIAEAFPAELHEMWSMRVRRQQPVRPDEAGESGAGTKSRPPKETALGHRVVDVDPSTARPVKGVESVWATVEYPGLGRLRGWLGEEAPHQFDPLQPAEIEDWSWRLLSGADRDSAFTEVGGDVVRGTWHKPWPDGEYYLFIDDDGRRHWAAHSSGTRNGTGAAFAVGELLKGRQLERWHWDV
jgi:hypothetical protein